MSLRPGDRLQHFKGGNYMFVGEARDADDPLKQVAVYLSEYGDLWVRPMNEFEGYKETEDGIHLKRFEHVGDGDNFLRDAYLVWQGKFKTKPDNWAATQNELSLPQLEDK